MGSLSNVFADVSTPKPTVPPPPEELVVEEEVLSTRRGHGHPSSPDVSFSRSQSLRSMSANSLLLETWSAGGTADPAALLHPREIINDFFFRKADLRSNWSVSVVRDPQGRRDRDVYTNKVTGQKTFTEPMSMRKEVRVLKMGNLCT